MEAMCKVCLRAEAVGGVPGAYLVRTWCVPGAIPVRIRRAAPPLVQTPKKQNPV